MIDSKVRIWRPKREHWLFMVNV